jgi:hypothetical protein
MNKHTLFFSHSSKDKELVLSLKNKIDKVTGGVLDIFMSSDGQSIPFGSNWIHKIEEGLNNAKIMFVFVTENSIISNWIYFEAGFAYSKGIEVIPVGIGIDIGALKAPLNLLQGFNIISGDSLNNFITVINKKFDYKFNEAFNSNDYDEINEITSQSNNCVQFDSIIRSISSELLSEYNDSKGGKVYYDIDKYFERIIDFLDTEGIQYSLDNSYHSHESKCIVVYGIKMVYKKGIKSTGNISTNVSNPSKISFRISPYNFEKSFALYQKINMLLVDKEQSNIQIRLNDHYSYVTDIEDSSSLISEHTDIFSFDKIHAGGYECQTLNLKFYIFDCNSWDHNKAKDYVLSIVYDPKTICAVNIIKLVTTLNDIKLIYKTAGGQENV